MGFGRRMFYVVSLFNEAFHLMCEIEVINFTIASGNMFVAYFNYDGVELFDDCVVRCFI